MAGIQKGTTFVDGNTYVAADLNNLVDNATPQPTIITQWAQKTLPIDADKFLVSDSANSGALVYSTLANLRNGIGSSKVAYGLTDTGSANAYAIACSPTITSYVIGQIIVFAVANTNTGASTIALDGLATKNIFNRGAAIVGNTLLINNVYAAIYDGTQFKLASVNDINGLNTVNAPVSSTDYISFYDASSTSNAKMLISYAKNIRNIVGGRLTLSSQTPVTTSDVTGATTIYYTPYKGNEISLFDGTAWNLYEVNEISLALSGMTTTRPQDIFIYDNSGTVTLERVEWSTGTARATSIGYLNGVIVKSGENNKRYIGTLCSTGATTVEDSITKRFVWNYYNRVYKFLLKTESTDTWTYTTATWRSLNNSTSNRVEAVTGLAEDILTFEGLVTVTNTSGFAAAMGIGIDSTSVNSSDLYGAISTVAGGLNLYTNLDTFQSGYHFYQALEISQAIGTSTWRGDSGITYLLSGLKGKLLC